VIGAHLDHIGVDDRGRIHHGADDNAGGSAAVLEIAEALGAAAPFLDRAVVVMWFTGEEKGLLGSRAFAANPTMPQAKIFAMINLDIIARGRPKAIEATQPNAPTMLTKLLPTAGRLSGANFKIGDGGKQFFERSDHFEFHKIGVPTVFFNEGETNADYHLWSDTGDKSLENKVAGVAKIALALGCLAANTEQKGGLKR
jgi:Zn-dependent M28 family amino/carboxypeptidase